MSDIASRLTASLNFDVINGDWAERSVLARQVREAISVLHAQQQALREAAELRATVLDLSEALAAIVNELDWSLLLEADDLPDRKQAHARLLHEAEAALAKARGES